MNPPRLSTCAVLLLFLAGAALAAEPSGPPEPGPKERCPVCGMFVGMAPNWLAAVVFKDGTAAFFDGPKCMFRYAQEPGKYTKGKKPSELRSSYVTEYYSARLTRAEDLYLVVGSDVLGPMGHELVPVDGKEQAATFLADHKGKKILRFSEVSANELKKLE